jgi:hypothetical protein
MSHDVNRQRRFTSFPPEAARPNHIRSRIYRHEASKGERQRGLPELVTGLINEGRHQAEHRVGVRITRQIGGPPRHRPLAQQQTGSPRAPPPPPAPRGDEGLSHTESPEPGVMPPFCRIDRQGRQRSTGPLPQRPSPRTSRTIRDRCKVPPRNEQEAPSTTRHARR